MLQTESFFFLIYFLKILFYFYILHNCISFAKYQNESATGKLEAYISFFKKVIHSWRSNKAKELLLSRFSCVRLCATP